MVEIWRDIKDYEGLYQVSNLGRVRNSRTGKLLKPYTNNNGYLIVQLCKNCKYKRLLIHRLVAQAFIDNPDNLPQVNHKDEDKLNNCVDNLEWCSISYNQNYGTSSERKKERLGKKVQQYTKEMVFVAEYPSIKEAARQTGLDEWNIGSCCKGKYGCKTVGGYIWKYKY